MGTKQVPATLPVELNFALNPKDKKINYHCSEPNGQRSQRNPQHLKLHRGDTIRFRSDDRFTIRFLKESPFRPSGAEKLLQSEQLGSCWERTFCVRNDAALAHYPYILELVKDDYFSIGVPKGVTVTEDPEVIIVDSGQNVI